MMAPCLLYLFAVVISVSSNPLGQLVQSSNAYQPTSYSNTPSIPVAIQPSSSSSYSQASTAQVPVAYPGPLGETLNQIVLNRILTNPSLQKIIDPNTKIYNQNGDEVQRQVTNTGSPNVINNYFIVPPEFFNLNETTVKSENDDINLVKKPRRRKLKKKTKKVKESPAEDDEVVVPKETGKRRKKSKLKRNRINNGTENDELIDEVDTSEEIVTSKNQERETKPKRRRKKKKEKVEPAFDDSVEVELPKVEEVKNTRKSKSKSTITNQESNEVIREVSEQEKTSSKTSKKKKLKTDQRNESSVTNGEDNVLRNIELPTDISSRIAPENRPTRDSKKKVPEVKNRNIPKKESVSNMTPFPDDVLKNFFPYMPMANFNNPDSNYPANFDHYYRYLDPVRNSNARRSKKKQKNQNRTNNEAKTNSHTIEIKLKPKKKEDTAEKSTEEPKVQDILVSIEVDKSTESIEQITEIPMEMPQKVSPFVKNEESASGESYETFSKLEDLHDLIMPELGMEEPVHPMPDNCIINDYYPVFDNDEYYSPDVEKINNIDDRYFYETGNKDERKMDRYEDSRNSKRDTTERDLDITDVKTKKHDEDINKFDHNEYLDHISKFSNINSSEHDIVKSDDDIRRVKVPSKNTRVKTENVETVFAGSKVAKYGVSLDEVRDDSSSVNIEESSSSERPAYVVAKSIGRPEDYW